MNPTSRRAAPVASFRKFGISAAVFVAAALVVSATVFPAPVFAAAAAQAQPEKIILPVRGMTCGACSGIIRDELRRLPGVVTVAADYEKGTATVTYMKDQVTVEQIVAAINKTGFKASMPQTPPVSPR